MDNKTLTKIEDSFYEHKRTVTNKIAYGAPNQKLQEALEQHFNEMVKNLERNLDSSELLTPSTYEFLHSEAPITFHELKHFAETHADSAIDAFTAAANRAQNSTIDVLSTEESNKEEQSEEFSGINKRKRATIEGQKEDDQRRDKFEIRDQIKNAISDCFISVQQVAVRNTLATDIADRLNHLKGLSTNVLEYTIEQLGADFDTHTEEIYSIIQAEMDKHESELLQIAGLDDLDRKTNIEAQNQEPVFTQELLDYFKSGNVDTSKLSPQECKWYLDFIFDEPLPTIVQTNNRDAFKDSLVDTLPASVLDNPFEETTSNNATEFKDGTETTILDVSPELQPLPPEVLEEYNKKVAAIREQNDDNRKNRDEDKQIDSLPDLFL